MNRTDPAIPEQYRRRVADATQPRVCISNSADPATMQPLAGLRARWDLLYAAAQQPRGTHTNAQAAQPQPQPQRARATVSDDDALYRQIYGPRKANAGTAAEAALYRTIYRR